MGVCKINSKSQQAFQNAQINREKKKTQMDQVKIKCRIPHRAKLNKAAKERYLKEK